MVEKFKQILAELEKKGKISLFAVLKMDNYVDKWSIVLCGENLIPGNKESFSSVVKTFNNLLTEDEKNLIARLGIFDVDDYIPQLFVNYKSGTEILKETKINGFVVYEGYILVSNIALKES
jgi:hypothetical protein